MTYNEYDRQANEHVYAGYAETLPDGVPKAMFRELLIGGLAGAVDPLTFTTLVERAHETVTAHEALWRNANPDPRDTPEGRSTLEYGPQW